jgi:hypothetical protein
MAVFRSPNVDSRYERLVIFPSPRSQPPFAMEFELNFGKFPGSRSVVIFDSCSEFADVSVRGILSIYRKLWGLR